jgi:preprotein translocase YajC subunit
MGTHILAAAAATKSSSSSSLLIIVVVFAVLMIFMFRSQRKRQRAAQDTQRQVANGSRVRTVHGIYGTVVDGDDRNVMLEIAPGVQIKMLRQAIAAVVPDDEPYGVNPSPMDMTPNAAMPDDDATPDGFASEDETPAKPEDRASI